MNERIKELWNRAADIAKQQQDPNSGSWESQVEFMNLFAELIVGECIGCCEQVISDPVPKSVDTWLNGGSQCIAEIKEHFGVEE